MRDFFGCPDALHAGFWIHQQPAQTTPQQQQQQQNGQAAINASSNSSSSAAAINSSSQESQAANNSSPGKQQQQPQQVWLQIDHAAVDELHQKLQSCHDDAVKDACCSACEKLLLHIATSAKQGKPNPGFCRQVGLDHQNRGRRVLKTRVIPATGGWPA